MAKLGRGITSGRPWIEITSDDLASVQKVGKCQLANADAKKLEEIVNRYLQMKAMEESHPDSRDAERYLDVLQNHTKALIGAFEAAHIDLTAKETPDKDLVGRYFALQDIFFAKADCQNAKAGKVQFLDQLRLFNEACEKAREAVQGAKLSSSKGRPQPIWLNGLLDGVGKIYEAAGGTPTAYWSEHERDGESGGQEGSAFVDFVHALIELMPPEHRPKAEKGPGKGADFSKKALAARITRWREYRLAAQKRTAN